MHFESATVALRDIDSRDIRYRITTDTSRPPLVASIRSVGILNPPILFKKVNRFGIVCGHRRIAALRCLESDHLPAQVISENASEFDCVKLAIADNVSQRSLNLVELSRSYQLIRNIISKPKEFPEIAASLGLPANTKFISKIRPLVTFPTKLQAGIIRQEIALPVALALMQMDQGAADVLIDLFLHLKLSLNKQKEILRQITEIAAREDLAVKQIVTTPEIQVTLNDLELDRNQQIARLRQYLQSRRFPEIRRVEKDFENRKQAMPLAPNMRLNPPKYFEAPTYTLQITFETTAELEQSAEDLKQLARDENMASLLKR